MEKKILLVDDDPNFRSMATTVLKEKGFTAICAPSAADAIIEFKSSKYDLLMIDGSLPDNDGLSLIEEFRKSDPDVAIVFVSASWRDSESYYKLTRELFVKSILHKPILPMVLAQEVDKALGAWLPTPLTKSQKIADKLERICAQYALGLNDAVNEINGLLAKAKIQNNSAVIKAAEQKLHKLRGTHFSPN